MSGNRDRHKHARVFKNAHIELQPGSIILACHVLRDYRGNVFKVGEERLCERLSISGHLKTMPSWDSLSAMPHEASIVRFVFAEPGTIKALCRAGPLTHLYATLF
jgi:hypothetical protein